MNVVTIAAILLIMIAFVTDIRKQLIPNWLSVGAFVLGVSYHSVFSGANGWLWTLWGAAAGFFPLLLLYMMKGIGAGDVKLFGAIGAWIGVLGVAELMMYSILYAGAIGVLLLAIRRTFAKNIAIAVVAIVSPSASWTKGEWLAWTKAGKSFPFMLAVAPAAVTLFILNY
ncbi:prepilin peptidase [Paenibacillus sp. GSMTC-2017]|uniref:A24 family peptidase n=1 Tax=Paenibacillus sp. GSMTC-2017 TaxID=2794350 RepID=UPI0018D77C13|nr:A24 family peptidase [Paenibacillus sp. GSMTC-2017]MBH5317468.1 prepilin peptidase [Paenibacillus sp. GSMTC-2017]